MELNEVLTTIFQVVIMPLLTALTAVFVKWINAKANEINALANNKYTEKYVTMLNNTITTAVIAVNQTYVDALKEQNVFTKEAQAEAFRRVSETVLATLTEEASLYLKEVIGDLDAYISIKIEEAVKENKAKK